MNARMRCVRSLLTTIAVLLALAVPTATDNSVTQHATTIEFGVRGVPLGHAWQLGSVDLRLLPRSERRVGLGVAILPRG